MLKKYSKMKALALAFLVMAGGFLLSCENNDDDKSSAEVVLKSFGPSGVLHGEDISFIGQGLEKVTSIVLPLGVEVPKSEFKTQNSNLIVLTVPVETTTGKVILKTAKGDIESKSTFGLDYEMIITSFTPEVKPGMNITIQGDFLKYVKEVIFTDSKVVTEFVSQSRTELVVKVPMDAKTGTFSISNAVGTQPQVIESEEELIVSLPAVTSITPLNVKHSGNLTLTGTNLDLVTSIKFPDGSIKTEFVSQTTTEIVVTVPNKSTDGKLTLSVASGVTVVSSQEIKIILPIVTAILPVDPSMQEIAGTTLTLTGTDLDLVAKIKFPGAPTLVTNFIKTGTTKIDVIVPTGVQGGTILFTTIHDFTVPVSVAFGNQLTLLKAIFDEALQNTFVKGGWGTPDIANTENSRVGTVSIKSTFTGGYSGGGQFGTWSTTPLSTSGTTYFAFSVYGGAGTDTKTLLINIAGAPQQQVTVDEGKWKDVKIALSGMGSPASISEISFQDANWSGVVYIDQLGLK